MQLALALSLGAARSGGGVAPLAFLGIGDSQTNNLGASNFLEVFADLVQTRQGGTVSRTHHGLPAQSWVYTNGVLPSLLADLPNVIPLVGPNTRITMFAGTNGMKIGGNTAAQEYADFETYLAAFLAQTTAVVGNIVVITMPPREAFSEVTRADYNARLVAGAVTHGYKLVKLHLNSDIGVDQQQFNTTWFSDQIHLTAAAHDQLGRICYDKFYTDFYDNLTAAQLTGYYESYDAQVLASLTKSSNRVSNWAARSGTAARDLAQATAGNQPLYNATGLNSLPALFFDGATRRELMACVNNYTLDASNMTFWMAVQVTTDATFNRILFNLNQDAATWANGNGLRFNSGAPGAGSIVIDLVNGGGPQLANSTDDSPHILTADLAGTAGDMFKDGAGGITGGSYSAAAVNATTLSVGGHTAADAWRLVGNVGELGFCAGRLTAYERQLWEKKLAAKWGMPTPNVP